MRQNDPIAISAGPDHRLPALFFPKVAPVPVFREDDEIPREIFQRIVLSGDYEWDEQFIDVVWADMLRKARESDSIEAIEKLPQSVGIRARHTYALLVHQHYAKQGVLSVPFFSSEFLYDAFLQGGAVTNTEFVLEGVPIIDPSEFTWKQILELREDPDFNKKLRAFRLLLYENYSDKDKLFIYDDLLRKLDDYETACRRNGLRMVVSTCKQVAHSKSLLATLGIATIGALTNTPVVMVASAIGGSVLEIGKIALTVAERKLDLPEDRESDAVAYLMDLTKLSNRVHS